MTMSPAWTGYFTIVRKETVRIFRIWTQTILPSVMTQSLYLVIFGGLIGSRIGDVSGMNYASFLIPGLVMMAVIVNSFSNVASAFFGQKFMKSIEEILVSPMKPEAILAGYVSGGIVRGLVVGAAVFAISAFFTDVQVTHVFTLFYFLFATSLIFSLLGFLNAMFARKFDDVGIVPTFVLTPLTYLGGVFYSLEYLPPFWRTVSHFNPIVYMIDGFRFGFSGVAATSVTTSAVILAVVSMGLITVCLRLLKKGVGLRT